jgi:hypothetical protein
VFVLTAVKWQSFAPFLHWSASSLITDLRLRRKTFIHRVGLRHGRFGWRGVSLASKVYPSVKY